MTRYVRIDYAIKPDVDLGVVKDAITEFVAGIASHHPDHRYTSFQNASEPRRFVHVGELVEEVVDSFQAAPFFLKFSQFLREHCDTKPEVTFLSRVASAR
ncbi:hypothetical protein DYQ86_05825 [Acidobacteria bacterium AB60]|nr:hypothetical protein DYQ86_05825 [Acidobacteria bacterium AB60]